MKKTRLLLLLVILVAMWISPAFAGRGYTVYDSDTGSYTYMKERANGRYTDYRNYTTGESGTIKRGYNGNYTIRRHRGAYDNVKPPEPVPAWRSRWKD
jgi:hypothetical protein